MVNTQELLPPDEDLAIQLRELLLKGFMIGHSYGPSKDYQVQLKFQTLEESQECHTLLLAISVPESRASLVKQGLLVTATVRTPWQPIETAPRNGTSFLASSPASSVFFAHWANGLVDSSSYDECGYHERYATHWMPLPAPVGE